MGRSEATKSSTMKASIILCLLLKLSKAFGEDVVNNIDNEEIHGFGLLDPPDDEKVDEASEQYFNHFRSLRSSVPASYSSVEKDETVAGPTDPPLTTAIPCFDKWYYCPDYAKEKCGREWMSQDCRKSCGLCPGMTPASCNTCWDKWDDCPDLAKEKCGWDWVSRDCRKACGLCGSSSVTSFQAA